MLSNHSSICGTIIAHGSTDIDENYLVIPKGIKLIFLTPCSKNLSLDVVIEDNDLLQNQEGRKIAISYYLEPFESGSIIPNMTLHFRTTWDRNKENEDKEWGIMTGIITTGFIYKDKIQKKNLSDNEFRNKLMCSNDNNIISKELLWDQMYKLKDILKSIESSKKFGTYYCICCRGLTGNQKMRHEEKIYESSIFRTSIQNRKEFLNHLKLEKCDNILINDNSSSKLKSRIIIEETLNFIDQIESSGEISDEMTFLLDNLCNKKVVSYKYFVIVLENKINYVNMGIKKMSNVVIENVKEPSNCQKFLIIYEKLLVKIKKNIIKFLNCNIQRENHKYSGLVYIDQIIYTGERIIDSQIITWKLYMNILECWEQYKNFIVSIF